MKQIDIRHCFRQDNTNPTFIWDQIMAFLVEWRTGSPIYFWELVSFSPWPPDLQIKTLIAHIQKMFGQSARARRTCMASGTIKQSEVCRYDCKPLRQLISSAIQFSKPYIWRMVTYLAPARRYQNNIMRKVQTISNLCLREGQFSTFAFLAPESCIGWKQQSLALADLWLSRPWYLD